MELDEWLWRNKMTCSKLAEYIDVTGPTIQCLRHKKNSPSMLIALKIYTFTGGEVSLMDMFTERDKNKFEIWLQEIRSCI